MKLYETFRRWPGGVFTPAPMPVTIENRPARILVRLLGWAVMVMLPAYCYAMTEYIHFADSEKTIRFFTQRTPAVVFGLGILYLLWLCALLFFKKGWLAALVYGFTFGLLAVVDYLKHAMTGDYFYPWDLAAQAGNVGELTNFITVPFPKLYAVLIAFALLLAVPVFFSGACLPVRWQIRYPLLAVVAGSMFFCVGTPEKATAVLNSSSLYLEDMALQSSNYSANGFVGAFTINLLSTNVQKPDDYSEAAVSALMEGYSDQAASAEFSSPDIILILSESFWDPTLLPGTEFSEDPLNGYRALCQQENAVSGRFFSTALGGGTVRPEFEVLTGMTTDYLPSGCVPWQYITRQTQSYVSIYKDLGYTTMAIHPYTSSFYCRDDVFPLIGIDQLHFEDDIYALKDRMDVTIRGKQISDETFADAIMYYMDQCGDAPVFVYGISMENHQPYPDKYSEFEITAVNPAFDADVANAVSNFTQGVSNADECLTMLADFVKNRDKDTVLVWFGDHLPTLGSNMGAYRQSGALDLEGAAYYEFIYSTPFVIYSNFDWQESDLLHPGSDNDIPSYNLMNGVAQLIGAPQTAFMGYMSDYGQAVPYYNVRLGLSLTDDAAAFADGHVLLTYDRVAGQRFSLD